MPLRMVGLLVLLLLHGAGSVSCPPGLNPVILDPLIEEYGRNISVNCTSAMWDEKEITLLIGNKTFTNTYGQHFVYGHIQLNAWNMMAVCKIQLNDSTKWIERAEITAYKIPEVTLSIEKIVGTQYKLQCDITNFAPAQNLVVTWYRDNEVLATNHSAKLTKEPVNETFALVADVNRTEKVVQFRCKAQLDLKTHRPLVPVFSQAHNVSVLYAPEHTNGFRNNISLSQSENLTLMSEAERTVPPYFQSVIDGKNLTGNTSQHKITEVNDSAIYTSTPTNDLGSISPEINVTVIKVTTSAPLTARTTHEPGCSIILTPPEIMVGFGDPVEVNCTSNTKVTGIGWEASVGGKSLEEVTALTWRVESLTEWNIKPLCYVNLINGVQCSAGPNITLYKTPDVVSVSAMDQGPMIEGREYQLRCDIISVAPAWLKVTWYHGNETVFSDEIQKHDTTPTNVSTYYKFTPERGDNGSVFKCEAELQLGPKGPESLPAVSSDPFSAVVYYKPLFKTFSNHYIVVEGNLTLNELPFEIDGNPPPSVKWYHQGAHINLLERLKRNDSGKYTFEAGNIIGTTNISFLITVEYMPSLTCENQYEVVEKSEIENLCKLDGLPSPSITWFKHEKERISQTHWTKYDGGKYLLKAINKHGAVEHKFNLQVWYTPVFEDKNTTIEITVGQNVTFNCSAEGNPSPEIHWIYTNSANVIVDTRGHYSVITITEATSVNAGLYHCVAKNVVGTVRRFVELVEIDYARRHASVIHGWMLPVAISAALLGLLILLVLWRNYKKKHGIYNLVANNVPMSHM